MKTAFALALAATLSLVACGGSKSPGAGGPSGSPSALASAESAVPTASAATGAPSTAPGGTDTPAPTPSPDANLLSAANGARLLTYPASLRDDPDDVAQGGVDIQSDSAPGPYIFLYELPTVESIATITSQLDAVAKDDPPRSVVVAISTTGSQSGFSDAGTMTAPPGGPAGPQTLHINAKARWIRLTFNAKDGSGWSGISAAGTIPPRTGPPLAGIFIQQEHPYKDGVDNGSDETGDPWYLRATSVGNGLSLTRCYASKVGVSIVGTLAPPRSYTVTDGDHSGSLVANDEGTELIGRIDNDWVHEVATKTQPAKCVPDKPYGTGPTRVLVLDNESVSQPYPFRDSSNQLKTYRFTRIPASMVDPSYLANADTAVLNGECDSSHYFSAAQGTMLVDWVGAGHKLAIYNADMCGDTTAYAFLPYQFETSNPGAGGAHGDRLIEVESDDLGSLDKTDLKHFVDATAYAKNDANQLGDANTVTSKDDHWCGHLFGTNSKHVNGFMEMYAPYQKGVFIFNGFDEDDSDIPEYQKVRDLELRMPLPADLPCNVKVDMSMVLQPSQEATFVAGKAQTLPFKMEVLANQGWAGHVNVTTQGSFATTVTPASFDMNGNTQPLQLAVNIPAGTPAGTYAVTAIATDPTGKTSQAVIQFNGEAPLKKILKKQRRIRLYGIHFDYDSAKIQPRSEPVIKDIADLMKADKTLRFQVEGHTDSDGGGPYNLRLSQARAQSVVNDLIHRYHIAASRLVPKGFGLTRPVASNATAGGKALNRRVELLRL